MKFIITNELLKRTIELEPAPPLERTKTRTPGKQATLKATLTIDVGNGQLVNCFRLALQIASRGAVDFSLPNDGPVENAEVSWHIDQGKELVQFYGKDVTRTRTDQNGQVTVNIEGVPQKSPIPESAPAVRKQARVYIGIALKPANLFRDLLDAVGVVAGGGAVAIASGLLERVGSRGAQLTFAVTDWAADYKVEYTQGATTISGIKCDGPEGRWDLDISGKVTEGDFTISVSGSVGVNLEPPANVGGDYRGSTSGDFAVVGTGPYVDINLSGDFSGTAEFRPSGEGGKLRFRLSKVSGELSGKAPGVSISALLAGGGRGLGLPVTVGSFCK